jgi:alkylation response protein AidB-like acyl-CoA dehydrogenase
LASKVVFCYHCCTIDPALQHPIFTDDHQQLLESMTSWVQKELYPQRWEWEQTTWPKELLARAGELGYLGLTYPEEYGGQGGDFYYSLVRAEALSYSLSGGTNMGLLVHSDMVTPPIEILGTTEQKERFLVPAIAGEQLGCLGISEPGAGSDVNGISTRAKRRGADWVVNGQKVFITNGMKADWCLTVVRTDDTGGHQDLSLLLIPLRDEQGQELPGVSARQLQKMGMHSSDTAELFFEDVVVPAENLLGTEGEGFYHIAWELQGERLVGAAGCVAGAQRAIELTQKYVAGRQAFGRPIAKFQNTRFALGQMETEVNAARQLTYQAAWMFANGQYPVKEISEAKLFAAQALCRVADQCLQLHGGWGYMQEYDIERIYRDARLNRIGAGTDEIMLEVIGRSLLAEQ